MSDLRIRVRYHDIEVELVMPAKPNDPASVSMSSVSEGQALRLVAEATNKVEQLITAGRRPVQS